jgi:dolichol-phosphate mannosyltransferase
MTTDQKTPDVSVVVPAYNERECLPVLFRRLSEVLGGTGLTWEVVVVDDGSRDDSYDVTRAESEKNPAIRGIRLSRNCGHQTALICGLQHARGRAVISMDADLQHPPEFIPELIRHWQEGYHVVNTCRESGQQKGFFKNVLSSTFYWFFNRVCHIELVPNGSDFRLMDRKCVDAVNSMQEYHKFLRGMIHYVGFRQIALPYKVAERHAGTPGYTFKKSLKLATDGVLSYSSLPLSLPFYLGLIVFAVVFGYLGISLALHAAGILPLREGWFSVMAVLLLSLALQLTFMGVVGVYVGKIFNEVKSRPQYFVLDDTARS